MRETPPSDYPKPSSDVTEDDSEGPTQLWESPFRYLSEFPVRRAARRRERIEALLKGQDITMTNVLSSTNLTRTSTSSSAPASAATATERLAQPLPKFEESEPQSIPTGTYTSVTPVNGPRLAVFIAVGVAVGGLAALQLNRFLTPAGQLGRSTFAAMAPARADGLVPAAEPFSAAPFNDSTQEILVKASEPNPDVPPLQVDVVQLRPPSNSKHSRLAAANEPTPAAGTPIVSPDQTPGTLLSNEPGEVACSRFPTIQVPTQLHPRMNPLMTSSQVFTERSAKDTKRQSSGR